MKTLNVAKVILVNQAGQVLLLRRSDDDIRRPGEWDIPGGHTETGEFAELAAARETSEEAGITINAKELQLVYSSAQVMQPDLNVVWLFYLAHSPDTIVQLSHEHSEFRWVAVSEIDKLITYERQKQAISYAVTNNLI